MFEKQTDFLALDFDGVIADSIDECLVVSHNAFLEYHGSGQKLKNINEIEKEKIDAFRRLRNFIRSGEDYVFIQLALHNRNQLTNQNDFDGFLAKNKHLKPTFFNLFYQEREIFSSDQNHVWIQLNPLYPGIKTFLAHYQYKENLFIITTKKIEYVHKILKSHDIRLKENNCLHAHGQQTKLKIIKNLLDKYEISADHFYFIDDQIDTLINVKQAEVQCLLAQWGYNNPEQWERAKYAGVSLLTLKNFLKQFQKT